MTFQSKIPLEQRLELRRQFKSIDYGDKCRFYYDQANKLGVSFTTVLRVVRGVSPRYAAKRDLAEAPILQALEQVGAQVWPLDYPVDLLVRFRDRWHLLEVKTGRGKKQRIARDKRQIAQQTFLATTGTPVCRTPLEALRAIGATPQEI